MDTYCYNCDKYSLVKDHWVCDLCRKYYCEDCVENLDQCIICKNIFCHQCGDDQICDDNSEVIDQVITYSKSITDNYPDTSHNFAHHSSVRKNVVKIAESMDMMPFEIMFLEIAALVHDILDHKYCYPELKSQKTYDQKREDLEKFLQSVNLPKYWVKRIIVWISNISYKQEKEFGYPQLEKEDIVFRDILSDADKLESLGETGILRCMEYAKLVLPNYSDEQIKKHVKNFIENRLLTLSNYFRTHLGKILANELLKETKIIYEYYK